MIEIFESELLRSGLWAALGLSLAAGPLGCFVLWRRLSVFGDMLSHTVLLGVALGVLTGLGAQAGIFLISALAVVMFLALQRDSFANETILILLAYSVLAVGILLVSLSLRSLRQDFLSYFVGDLFSVSRQQLWMIYVGGGAVLATLAALWRPLLAHTIFPEIAQIEQGKSWVRPLFLFLLAAFISFAVSAVGLLLVSALLIIPAATARNFSKSPLEMVVLSVIFGILSSVLGFLFSYAADLPGGASIVAVNAVLFFISLGTKVRT